MNREEFSNSIDRSLWLRVRVVLGTSLIAFAAGLMTACAPAGSTGPGITVKGAGAYAHLDADEKIAMADVLVDEAEEKLGFATAFETWGKFNEALQLNPENDRAQFWKEILKPLLEMKGLVARVRPLYLKQPRGAERYAALLKGIDGDSSPEYRKFVTEGPNDIDTDEKFRELMDRSIVSLDSLRSFLKAHKDHTFKLRTSMHFVAGAGAKFEDGNRCAALKIMGSKFQGCPASGILSFKLNRADLEALQYMVTAEMMQLSVLFAYNLNPITVFDGGKSVTPKLFIERLTKGFPGGLMERNRLSLANSVVPDWISAQKYFMQNQTEVCKNGQYNEENRPGFLISSGFCFSTLPEEDGPKTLAMLESMMLGQPVKVDLKFLERPVSVYPMKFFNAPPTNILPLLPTEFDANGESAMFDNAAYATFFAEGSMSDVLRADRMEKAYNEYRNTIRYDIQMKAAERAARQQPPLPRM